MAITTTTFSRSVGWARTDVIAQLESAFSYLGWHGGTLSGIVTGIVGVQTGGVSPGGIATYHTNVFPSSTSGIGTGVSFDIYRGATGGQISQIFVNRPGVGYTNGEVVQIPASAIGGSINGAVGIALTLRVAGGASPIGFGTTTAFFAKDNSGTYPWGVMRHTIQANKKYGDIYRAFQVNSSTNLRIHTGPFFHPGGTVDNLNNLGMGYTNTFRGDYTLDVPDSGPTNSSATQASSSSDNYGTYNLDGNLNYASNNSYRLDLNLYGSGIDPKFVVFSYAQPTLSSLKLTDNTFDTFFFHNFNSTLWDYDNVFLGGMTKVIPSTNTSNPSITFRTYTASHFYITTTLISKRSAEIGYMAPDTGGSYSSVHYVDYYIESNTYDQRHDQYNNNTARIYYRNTTNTRRSTGGYNNQNSADSNANFNAVIKGIPLNGSLIPVPYYIPDDFVLIDFDYASPSANIQQGDTITISGSEVYTVITGSYNQTTRTRGILFCGRKV